MTPELFTQITGYELQFQQITCPPLAEYKIVTKDSFYQIFSKIDDAYEKCDKKFHVEIHDNDVLIYL
jgi:hypothetical protein